MDGLFEGDVIAFYPPSPMDTSLPETPTLFIGRVCDFMPNASFLTASPLAALFGRSLSPRALSPPSASLSSPFPPFPSPPTPSASTQDGLTAEDVAELTRRREQLARDADTSRVRMEEIRAWLQQESQRDDSSHGKKKRKQSSKRRKSSQISNSISSKNQDKRHSNDNTEGGNENGNSNDNSQIGNGNGPGNDNSQIGNGNGPGNDNSQSGNGNGHSNDNSQSRNGNGPSNDNSQSRNRNGPGNDNSQSRNGNGPSNDNSSLIAAQDAESAAWERALEAAAGRLTRARAALRAVPVSVWDDLRRLRRPPPVALAVLGAALSLLGDAISRPSDGGRPLRDRLLRREASDLTPMAVADARKWRLDTRWPPTRAARCHPALGPLHAWVHAMCAAHDALRARREWAEHAAYVALAAEELDALDALLAAAPEADGRLALRAASVVCRLPAAAVCPREPFVTAHGIALVRDALAETRGVWRIASVAPLSSRSASLTSGRPLDGAATPATPLTLPHAGAFGRGREAEAAVASERLNREIHARQAAEAEATRLRAELQSVWGRLEATRRGSAEDAPHPPDASRGLECDAAQREAAHWRRRCRESEACAERLRVELDTLRRGQAEERRRHREGRAARAEMLKRLESALTEALRRQECSLQAIPDTLARARGEVARLSARR